ncbi:DUF1906 domain-containing protein [Bacillus carboniphilus]|uniref:DUF1906 domain-containing protein n=1 Tax=Bacillus carboniphilus TaxID=86663 RepID=A0ABP3GBN5_9BACI
MERWKDVLLYYFLPALLLIGLVILASVFGNPKENADNPSNENPPVQHEPPNKEPSSDQPAISWGVDSASITNSEMFACVRENFGEPAVWGRYLGDKEGVSFGLTENEAQLLHAEGTSILLIYNHFTDARGYDHGMQQGNQAIEYAKNLGAPAGVTIFADIEPNYPVNDAFIRGWHDALAESDYTPGIYGIFSPDRELTSAFLTASEANPNVKKNTNIWSAFPQVGITSQQNAPDFQGEGPDGSRLYGWQYGIDAETCNIDTNLFKAEMFDFLWKP